MELARFGILFILVGVAITTVSGEESHLNPEDFIKEYEKYKQTGLMSLKFQKFLTDMTFIPRAKSDILSSRPNACILCEAISNALLKYATSGKSYQEIRQLIIDICLLLDIYSDQVCIGVVDLNLHIFLYIIGERPDLTPKYICNTILQSKCLKEKDPSNEWTVDVPLGPKPSITVPDPSPSEEDEILTIVQLTDIHFDPNYEIGGNAACNEPTCCRIGQGPPSNNETAAGYWGDYRSCDLPWQTWKNMLENVISQHPKIDYVYMTGDLIDHGVWETSRETNKYIFNKILTDLKSTFKDIPVFPALGNHEPSPLNVYAPPEITNDTFSTKWLYETMAGHWSQWLPEETQDTILRGGFYTTLARPGLRIVVLNNNVCYSYNWWLLYDSNDPSGQLKWLAETLLEAEKAGEKVHILAHVPPGDAECHYIWSQEFRKLIDRFEHTVAAHFNGHSHNDEFHLFYSMDDPTRAINVAFDGGSATTFSDLNSNYRVYKVHAATGVVLDLETWIYNLTDANFKEKPTWYKMYSFKEAYGVKSLAPMELDKLAHRMAADHELLLKYHRYYVKMADPSLAQGCDDSCLKTRLCGIVSSDAIDRTQCNQLLQEFGNTTSVQERGDHF